MKSGADPGFQVRGGALKKIAPSGGRHQNVWDIRVKNHDFTPKNHIVSNCGGRRENCWDISCEKITILRQKIIFFPILGGGGARAGCAPLWIRPWKYTLHYTTLRHALC